MFDRLIDFLIEFVELFRVFVFVREFEEGVVLRQGKFHRTLGPGFHRIIPAGQEELIVLNVKPEPLYLDIQSLHTSDEYPLNIQVGLIWHITDIKKFLIDNDNTPSIIGMLCSGVVTRSVQATKWKELRVDGYPGTLRAPMNRKVRKKLGAEIDEVVIQDFVCGSADRLWHEGISLTLGED